MIWLAISKYNDYSKITITTISVKKKKRQDKEQFLPITWFILYNNLKSSISCIRDIQPKQQSVIQEGGLKVSLALKAIQSLLLQGSKNENKQKNK